jgi:hypothetical protein
MEKASFRNVDSLKLPRTGYNIQLITLPVITLMSTLPNKCYSYHSYHLILVAALKYIHQRDILVKNDSSVLINYNGSWVTCFMQDAGNYFVQLLQFSSDDHILTYLELFKQGNVVQY